MASSDHIFGSVLEFVLKFAILVLNIKHQNGFSPEHLAPKSFLHLNGVLPEHLHVKSTKMAFCKNTFYFCHFVVLRWL